MHIAKQKKSVWKGYILHEASYITFFKKQNFRDNKKISDWKVFPDKRGEMNSQWREGF
jgi:hypothetical protein